MASDGGVDGNGADGAATDQPTQIHEGLSVTSIAGVEASEGGNDAVDANRPPREQPMSAASIASFLEASAEATRKLTAPAEAIILQHALNSQLDREIRAANSRLSFKDQQIDQEDVSVGGDGANDHLSDIKIESVETDAVHANANEVLSAGGDDGEEKTAIKLESDDESIMLDSYDDNSDIYDASPAQLRAAMEGGEQPAASVGASQVRDTHEHRDICTLNDGKFGRVFCSPASARLPL